MELGLRWNGCDANADITNLTTPTAKTFFHKALAMGIWTVALHPHMSIETPRVPDLWVLARVLRPGSTRLNLGFGSHHSIWPFHLKTSTRNHRYNQSQLAHDIDS
jgi:hypothetical protein